MKVATFEIRVLIGKNEEEREAVLRAKMFLMTTPGSLGVYQIGDVVDEAKFDEKVPS